MRPYIPYRVDEVERIRLGESVRIVGYIVKEGGKKYLKDPLSEKKIPLIGEVPSEKHLVEVFGVRYIGGLRVNKILEAEISEELLKSYKAFIRREREELLIEYF